MSLQVVQSSESDDVVDRAARALQSVPTPAGPTPMLAARTRRALASEAAAAGEFAGMPLQGAWRWAAAVLVAASVTGAWVMSSHDLGHAVAKSPAVVPVSPSDLRTPMLTGLVMLQGPPPVMTINPMFHVEGPSCGHHPTPMDESIVVTNLGGVSNVVVSVVAGLPEDASFAHSKAVAVLDQKDCRYVPHVVAIQVGQDLVAKNGDPFFHTVHTNSFTNTPVDIAQNTLDRIGTRVKPIKEAETFKVTCDLHPWMSAWVAAFDHPYFAVTRTDGSFAMPALPPGSYTLRAWHERLGSIEQQVMVKADGKLPAVKFSFTQQHLAAALSDRLPVASAATVVGSPCCVDKH